ncbi:hypothetical protein Tco_0282618 [Tanacetum coccineum]
METKDTVFSCSVSKNQEIQRLQEKARLSKEGCMNSFRTLQTNTAFLLRKDFLSYISIPEGAFERAFLQIFGVEVSTFKRIFSQNLDKLEEQLTKDKLHENDSNRSFTTLLGSVPNRIEAEEDDDPDDITDIFKIEGKIGTYEEYELNNPVKRDLEEPWSDNGVPYQLCDHICEPYHFKNGITKWPTCSLDIDRFCNGGELPGMVRVENMAYFQDHKWYDELVDGKLKEETLMHKAKVEESWGKVTPDVMKYCAWLINSFRNFHELDYNVLVKLQECWWKINAHEVAPFTRLESYGQRSYANIKTEKANDPYLEGHKECRDDPTLEPSVCKIRRFEMMKYSFNADEEYIAIKESEYLNHSKDNLDTYRELLRIIDEGWVMATPDDE